jgi:hypothetical protein
VAKKKSFKALIAILISIVVIAALWIGISLGLYTMYFGRRFETNTAFMNHVEAFEGLERTRYEFASDKGQTIVGYLYSSGTEQKAIIVLAHGYGAGGHNSYLPTINYFAQNGFYVFAYDATGNDESEGKAIGGVPQGVIDLDYAISFVEESGNFPDLPIGLFGHSWGGYSVSNVLTYHPEVEAVIECSGPNSSSDLVEGGGTKIIGPVVKGLMPVIKVYERAKYGDYATNSALIGFASTDAEIMVVHSGDDNIVPIEYGYDIYYEAFKDDPRFTFIRLDGKGHNQFLNVDNNRELYESFVAFYDENLFE